MLREAKSAGEGRFLQSGCSGAHGAPSSRFGWGTIVTRPDAGAKAAARVLERLERLYEIGGGEGANRPGLGTAEQEAHDLVSAWLEEAGLAVEVDPWGNLLGRLPGTESEAGSVWTGSHLDTVPGGGRFDGALGVVAGLEAVERIATRARRARALAVVAFRDEEGARSRRGCFGSRGRTGLLGPEDGADLAAYASLPAGALPAVYLEAHVEQGPVLERAGAPLGVVTSIAGQARGEATIHGAAAHAGTTPMDAREDALCAAAEHVLRIRDAARAIDGTVATVGRLSVEPGAANVVPARVRLTIDARAPDARRLDALVAAIDFDLARTEPVEMAPEPTQALREELERLGLPVVELASGAGHDAGILAAAGVGTAMLFVRSAGGISHSPDEETSEADIALCVEVLAGALARLAR